MLPSDTTLRDMLRARLPQVVTDLRALARDRMPEAAATREAGYTIRNAAGDEAVIRIYDEIWWLGVNAQDFVNDLDGITAPSIRVDINSPGGSVFDGISIYNALRNHPAHVTTRVDGLAASIASVIAQAGDTRLINPSGQLMIHNAHAVTMGDRRDHEEMATLLEQQDAVLANIYASRSGRDASAFRELMNAETWFTAERAIAEGLADAIVEQPSKEQPAARATLLDEISAAVGAVAGVIDSAERVAALRADAGKDLSNAVRESLVGLRDASARISALIDTPTSEQETAEIVESADTWSADELSERMAEIERQLAELSAS